MDDIGEGAGVIKCWLVVYTDQKKVPSKSAEVVFPFLASRHFYALGYTQQH